MRGLHPLHDPTQRAVVGRAGGLGTWELRQFPADDPRRAYFARTGFAHLQLWHPVAGVSVLTPSRLTRGELEAWIDGDRVTARSWSMLELELALRGVQVPGRHTFRAIERWFVLADECSVGRLLRTWWAAGS